MNAENLYEYAVIRYVPRIERGEFVNIGLIMMCKRRRWIKSRLLLPERRLEAMGAVHTSDAIVRQAHLFVALCDPVESRGHAFGDWPVEERFRWLTAVKSSCLTTSRPHAGLTDDLEATFDRLFSTLVE